jgi:hypothetical protein
MGDWNQCKIICATGTTAKSVQTIPEQHTGKARNLGTAKNSHIGHCTHTTKSANIKEQNIFHGQNNITCSIDCKY